MIYDLGFDIFYRPAADDNLRTNDLELQQIKNAVKKNAKTFIDFKQFI